MGTHKSEQRPVCDNVVFDELTLSVDTDAENVMRSVISLVFCYYIVTSIMHKLH